MNNKQLFGVVGFSLAVGLFPGVAFAQDEGAAEGGDAAPAEEKPAEEKPAAESAAVSTDDMAGDKKIRLGLRLGYGIPLGSSSDGVDLSETYSGMLPIWVDAGYMVTPNIMVGLYFQYGIGFIADCPSGASCSGSDMRFGLQGQYHLAGAEKKLDPWFGLGIGYEIASASAEAGGAEVNTTVKGFEFLNLQGGVDFPVGDALSVGPFLSFSLGQYSSATIEAPAPIGDSDGDITDKAMHEWLVIGVKGTFAL